ncbi:MAG: class I SAM-dependent methyltransferase [Thermoplasmata archaeon]
MTSPAVVRSWESEYRHRRYLDEPPIDFVKEIQSALAARGLSSAKGLYIGCGNGRNYVPLANGGLDLVGLDISFTALRQLTQRTPEQVRPLVRGDLRALDTRVRFAVVIAIQVFQHGSEATTHRAVLAAREHVAPGGLFCIRVNAIGTEPEFAHEVVEQGEDGRFTVQYHAGPKEGVTIHFFSRPELEGLVGDGFLPVLPLRSIVTARSPPPRGHWIQWEGIWSRRSNAARIETPAIPRAGKSSIVRPHGQ